MRSALSGSRQAGTACRRESVTTPIAGSLSLKNKQSGTDMKEEIGGIICREKVLRDVLMSMFGDTTLDSGRIRYHLGC